MNGTEIFRINDIDGDRLVVEVADDIPEEPIYLVRVEHSDDSFMTAAIEPHQVDLLIEALQRSRGRASE